MTRAATESELPDPTETREGEFAKSGRTRRRILDAAILCLAEEGYKRLSTSAVAARAGLSRAAMLYHFPSRRDLVEALVWHLIRRRVDMYEEAVSSIPHDGNFRARAVDLAWESLETPEFAAFIELSLAARTEAELAEVMPPALAAFEAARREAAKRIFPDGIIGQQDVDLGRDVVRYLSEGVMQQGGIVENGAFRTAALRHFLRRLVASEAGARLLRETLDDLQEGQP
ncbi:MAG: TetR/AcrR family transcriptional regulator [Thermaurantiacus sp.]